MSRGHSKTLGGFRFAVSQDVCFGARTMKSSAIVTAILTPFRDPGVVSRENVATCAKKLPEEEEKGQVSRKRRL